MRIALYAGSFDPITNGHLDVIERAAGLFDKLVVTVARNASKSPLFSIDERIEMVQASCTHLDNVEVSTFTGLLKDAVESFEACCVVRGLRSVSDYEHESQMAMMNRELNPNCETVFFMPSPKLSYVSSRMIREIATFDGDVSAFVPKIIAQRLKERLQKNG
ncbi:MAG: pantetheine-phosphate adenylyltransferase [Lentisphaeraceae bacterium]|nr:pantetheine-phosphate adenylyltransferase [Lentisphaeraceae bacterium]